MVSHGEYGGGWLQHYPWLCLRVFMGSVTPRLSCLGSESRQHNSLAGGQTHHPPWPRVDGKGAGGTQVPVCYPCSCHSDSCPTLADLPNREILPLGHRMGRGDSAQRSPRSRGPGPILAKASGLGRDKRAKTDLKGSHFRMMAECSLPHFGGMGRELLADIPCRACRRR